MKNAYKNFTFKVKNTLQLLSLVLFAVLFSVTLKSQSVNSLYKDINSENYPNADFVTIYDSTYTFMEETGLSHVDMHYLNKVLTYKGAYELKNIKFDYDPLSAYVEIKEVIVHKEDGSKKSIDVKNNTLDYAAPARGIYWGARQVMVDLGRLDIGDLIEVKCYRKGFTYALLYDDSKYIPPMKGHFYDIVPFWSDHPIVEKVYKLNILKEKNLQYEVYNDGIVKSENTQDKDNSNREIYTFTKKDINPIKRPPYTLANNDIQPKLLLSTSPDWYAKARWFYGVNEDFGSFNSYPALQEKVDELLVDAKNELDSISILTHWVADNMRYSGLSMGEGEGYTLHNAEMNFTDRCGVCKDKASLLIAMLRAAGFESYAAMTMAGERIDRIPADQFNHSVTVVKRRNGDLELLDPTWVPNIRELWSSAEQQQHYLMGLPDGSDLMETPISAPENHYIKINGNSRIDENSTLHCKFYITAEGQSDNAVRRIFSARYEEWYGNAEMELLKVDHRAQDIKIEYTDNDKFLEQPVKITYSFNIPNYALVTDEEIIFTPFTAQHIFKRAMNHLYYDTSLETREYPFRDRCSRLVQIEETIELPKYKDVTYLPDNEKVSSKYISFNGGYSIEKNTLKLSEIASFGKRIYEADEWESYRNAVDAQNKFSKESIILSK